MIWHKEVCLDQGIVSAPRTPLSMEVHFKKSYAREDSLAILRNISLTGAFLNVENSNFRPCEKIHLVLNVSGRIRKLAAEVVWTSQTGCGIKFLPTNNRDVQIIDDLIYFVEEDRSGRRSVYDDILKKVS